MPPSDTSVCAVSSLAGLRETRMLTISLYAARSSGEYVLEREINHRAGGSASRFLAWRAPFEGFPGEDVRKGGELTPG